jgi:hypothetical protein
VIKISLQIFQNWTQKTMGIVVLWLFFGFCAFSVDAQQPYAIHLNKTNGLPSNSVYTVFQDSKGFIWLATNEGLSLYDGFSYTTFKSDEQTSTPGSCIKEDKMGRIWYENFDGNLYYVDHHRKKLQSIALNPTVGFVPFAITDLHLLVFQKEGVDAYDISNLEFIKTVPLKITNLHHATNDTQNIYFIHDNKLYKIDQNLELTSSKEHYNPEELNKQLYFTDKGLIVLSKYNEQKKIHLFDNQLNEVGSLAATEPQFIQGASYIDDAYWIHTTKGSVVVDKNSTSKTYYPEKSISSVFKDRQNNYWFTTTNEGIFVVPNLKNTIQNINGYLPSKIIKLSHQEYLIGTKKGELLRTNHLLTDYKTIYTSPDNGEFHYLHLDTLSNLIAFSSKGFTMMDAANFKEIHSVNNAVKELCSIDSSYFAYASSSIYGVFKNPKLGVENTSKWHAYFSSFPIIDTYFIKSSESIRARSVVYNKNQNALYYATNIGLFKVTPTETVEIKMEENSFYASKLLLYDKVLYALTTKGNLYKIVDNHSFELLNEKMGVPNFEIKMIKKFKDYLLFVSPQSIHRLNTLTGDHFIYDVNIAPYEINDILLDDSVLYILTNSGIIKNISTHSSINSSVSSLFVITDFKVGNESCNSGIENTFDYSRNRISISYSVLDYGKIIQEPVYYNLNNEGWKLISSETRTLEFPSLSPGSYSLQFKLGNTIQEPIINFTITPPFWLTWWFFVLCFLVLLSIGWLYYRYQISLLFKQIKLLRENIQLEKNLSKSILTSIKSQMNPHFFYNALNTIQAYIFTNDAENAGKYLSKFSKLTRKILEMSESDTVLLSEEIETLTLYLELEQVRFDDNFTFDFDIDQKLDLEMVKIPPMLVQPYVENAVKHGLLHKQGEKKIHLKFEKIEKLLVITLEDNGIGRKRSEELNSIKNAKHKSFSTEANAKRLEVLNQGTIKQVALEIIDQYDESNQSIGTIVILKIPI